MQLKKKPDLQNSHKIVKKPHKSTKIFGASRKPPLCKQRLTARERGGAVEATRMELGMEPGMELGIERDRVKRSRKDNFLGGEIFLSGTFRSFVTPIKGGLSLVQNLNSSAHWWLNLFIFKFPFLFGPPFPVPLGWEAFFGVKKLWVKRNRRTVGDERLCRIDGYGRSRGHGIEVLCWLLRGESRKGNEVLNHILKWERARKYIACEEEVTFFFFFFSDVAVVDVSKLLFGTWIGNRLNRVALSMPVGI